MQKNSYLKEAKLEEVMEIYDEFYDYIDDEFSSEELLKTSNFVEIARGKISKEKLKIIKVILPTIHKTHIHP